ncbi:transcriptional regulator domain-containing protein [Caulobacter sp. CCH9-E1]|uniref:transcriptional regulator domain-containing protein n=1 Tax=Caulobacter sp. CCH9-E1 TaxID=1768768 RepID=UPI003510A4B6
MAKPLVAAVPPPLVPESVEPAGVALCLARLAWEFLRRNPRYRADYARLRAGAMETLPGHWGLRAPVDPDAVDIAVDAIWRGPPILDVPRQRRARTIRPAAASLADSPPTSVRCSRRACPDDPQDCRTGA